MLGSIRAALIGAALFVALVAAEGRAGERRSPAVALEPGEAAAWQAEALFCPLRARPGCVVLRDERGPWDSEAACRARAAEMLAEVLRRLGPPLQTGIRCTPAGGGGEERAA